MNIDEKLEEVTMLFKQLKMAQEDNIIEHGLQIKEEPAVKRIYRCSKKIQKYG